MKRMFSVILAAMVSLGVNLAYADTTPSVPAQSMQVGVVDISLVLQKAPQLNALRQKLKEKYAPEEKQLIDLQKQMQADAEKMRRDGSVMSAADRTALQKKLDDQQIKMRDMQVKFQQEIYAEQTKQMQDVMKRIQDVVSKVAKDQKLNIVFLKAAVAYAANEYDITDLVIKEMK